MFKLYQTKKLDGQLNLSFDQSKLDNIEVKADLINSWFGDVFFINRKKNLIFTNELTKFSFLLLDYRKSNYPDFAATFKNYLAQTMQLHNIPPEMYLNQATTFTQNKKSNRSSLAHLSRFKIDFVPTLKIDAAIQDNQELWQQYSLNFNTYLTSYPNMKGYKTPVQVMKNALESRQLL